LAIAVTFRLQHEQSGSFTVAHGDLFFAQAFKKFFVRTGGFVFRADSEFNQIVDSHFKQHRAAVRMTTAAHAFAILNPSGGPILVDEHG
jgi:hypothetical protein